MQGAIQFVHLPQFGCLSIKDGADWIALVSMGICQGLVLLGISDNFLSCIGETGRESPIFAAGEWLQVDIGK